MSTLGVVVRGSILLVLIFAVILFLLRTTTTKPFLDENGKKIKDSLAEEIYLSLGGVKQWVLLRGRSIHNPILTRIRVKRSLKFYAFYW